MSMKLNLFCVSAVTLLTACGGGGSTTSDPVDPMVPVMTDMTAPSISLTPSSLSVSAGSNLEFEITATDSGGFGTGTTEATCAEGSLTTTITSTDTSQTLSANFGAPATAGSINCMVTSTDAAGNAETFDFQIVVTQPPVSTSTFNGTWFSPCYNNGFGFSVRQTLNINGTTLDSFIESFTAGAEPAQNCILPADGALITTDVRASLDFQSNVDVAGCVNDTGVDTAVNIQTVDTSGNPTATSEPEITDTLNLVTGFTDILPDSTDVCVLANGNLLFAGVQYTDADSNSNIVSPTFDLTTDGTWSLGDNNYVTATTDSSADGATNIGSTIVMTEQETENGDFSGSRLALLYTLNGSGVYQVTSEADFTGAGVGTSEKLVFINAGVGLSVGTNATSYVSSENNGFVTVVLDDAGRYHFSTATGIALEQSESVDGGVADAPDNFSFEMTNVFDSFEE